MKSLKTKNKIIGTPIIAQTKQLIIVLITPDVLFNMLNHIFKYANGINNISNIKKHPNNIEFSIQYIR